MTTGDKIAIGGVVVAAGVAVGLWLLDRRLRDRVREDRVASDNARMAAAKQPTASIGDAIASIGGAAVTQMGKQAGSWTQAKISGLFG